MKTKSRRILRGATVLALVAASATGLAQPAQAMNYSSAPLSAWTFTDSATPTTASVKPALGLGAFYGSAGAGRISSATRADLAAAAAKVLTTTVHHRATLELAGDESYTLAELAAEISRQSGKQIPYVDIPEERRREAEAAGLAEDQRRLLDL